ncbi:MAG: PDZ domain-containing protein [Acidobacteria bacterium]|nr:PDZ domain-containing protein [Acidobacteriota bacterium]
MIKRSARWEQFKPSIFAPSFKNRIALLLLLASLFAASASRASAQGNQFRVDYTVEVASTGAHLFHVTADFQGVREPAIDLALPTWTPGWYTVENYAKNVLRMKFTDGEGHALAHRLTRKQTWRVETGGAREIKVEFDYFANVLALNQAKITDDFAFFTGTQLFLEPAGHRAAPYTVRLKVPAGWQIVSALKETNDREVFTAPDYDTLVDSPTEAGRFDVTRFEVEGKPHLFVSTPAGAYPQEKRERLAQMLARVASAQSAIFGGLPYEKYIYFYFFARAESNAGGALEHNNSHVAFGRSPQAAPEDLTGTASHEFFHLWNVKRIRPAEMFPYDYSRENETPSLWVSEGFTNYYGSLATYRASLRTREEFLQSVAGAVGGVELNEARAFVSPADASVSTWLCYDTPCAFEISYYTQGQNLAALFDLSIRHDTAGAHSLDDVMRSLYENFYKRGRGFTEEDFVSTVSRISGRDYKDFFRRYVVGTEVPPYDQIFAYAGYRLERASHKSPNLGVRFNATEQGLEIVDVGADTPGARAGLQRGDLVTKIDDARPRSSPGGGFSLTNALEGKIDQNVKLTVRRGADEKVLEAKIGSRELTDYKLVEVASPTPEQLKVREGWLKR